MNSNALTLFFFLLISAKLSAQTDTYAGTWQMKYMPDTTSSAITIELEVATPERNILYPAHLKLQCDSFIAEYELLLVKKDSRQLAISSKKYPLYEKPFSLGDCTAFLNGVFDESRDLKDILTLTDIRIESKQNNSSTQNVSHLGKAQKITAIQLMDFLKNADIRLKKINDIPWRDENIIRILSPTLSPAYFGLLDTMYLQTHVGTMNLTSNKKPGTDSVSVAVNGDIIIDELELNKKNHTEDIILDTGLNILALFADNFGNALPNKGNLNLDFNNEKINLDFTNKADSGSTFIVAKLYCAEDEEQKRYFKNYVPGPDEMPLQKNEKLISSVIATDQQIILAVWDDAVEDGDSVSIKLNGKWIVQGMRVKNNTQFVTVTLQPGPNTITFIADNLGTIPPNTSVLEIIDGKKRKAFTIETTPEEKNLIKIFYDTKTGL
jgi:hypothetical protein